MIPLQRTQLNGIGKEEFREKVRRIHRLEGTDFVLNGVFSRAVQNVHNLSLAGYCEQDR